MPTTIASSGSCLCGAVTIDAAQLPLEIGACHCVTCRAWSGGPFISAACGAEVKIKGLENVSVYDSSEWAERGFCKTCGTHLFYRIKQNQDYHLPAGLFPDAELNLVSEIFIDQKSAGYSFAGDTAKMTGAEVFALYAPKE